MSARRFQICAADRPLAMISFVTKLSVKPGRNFRGQMMAACCGLDIVFNSLRDTVDVRQEGKAEL